MKSILSDIKGERDNKTFMDPFCGSGVISRVAKTLNMNVIANDTQYFSYLVNSVYLTLHKEELASMFSFMGGVDAYFSYLNMSGLYSSTSGHLGGKAFLSEYYAPKETNNIVHGRERLFYSRENALFLDGVRNDIENSFLEGKLSVDEKNVAIASILYQALRCANISGTFTSYHKQIVGDSPSVKKRVSEDITLLIPNLLNKKPAFSQVYQQDALDLTSKTKADIVYIDPPSHPQQYGSAYHLLNSIALWDDFTPSGELDSSGKLKDVSGIRDDWKKSKSLFCSVKESYKAFVTLLHRIDAPHIIISYPSNGILSLDELYEIIRLSHRSIKTITIGKVRKGGKASFDKKGVSENLFITGEGIKFSLLMPQGIEITSKIGRIESYYESVFTPITEPVNEMFFIKGIVIDQPPSYKMLSSYNEAQLDEILHILECHVITDSFSAITQIMDVYTQQFPFLSGDEKVRLEKKCLSLLRYMVGYEKDRLDEVFMTLDTCIDIYKDEMSTRETFLKDLHNVKKGSFVR
jgi:adenine-specific DNA-methyltransferase